MCRFRHLYDAELNGEYGHQDDLRDITLSATDLAIHKVTGQGLNNKIILNLFTDNCCPEEGRTV